MELARLTDGVNQLRASIDKCSEDTKNTFSVESGTHRSVLLKRTIVIDREQNYPYVHCIKVTFDDHRIYSGFSYPVVYDSCVINS